MIKHVILWIMQSRFLTLVHCEQRVKFFLGRVPSPMSSPWTVFGLFKSHVICSVQSPAWKILEHLLAFHDPKTSNNTCPWVGSVLLKRCCSLTQLVWVKLSCRLENMPPYWHHSLYSGSCTLYSLFGRILGILGRSKTPAKGTASAGLLTFLRGQRGV